MPANTPAPLALLFLLCVMPAVSVAEDTPYPGTVVITTPHSYPVLIDRLERAIAANGMGLVARASASGGAAKRGVTIPGNEVLMVFRNDYAVRMLAASVPAGIEAPLRLYVTENADGTASITYRRPSAVFAPYGSMELDAMAAELDPIFARIVATAGNN
ncbi:DUF302 domain-containing protein [Sulfurivermis fontis]|uniref:DUF302 domain-containing protein n=1 Tax=Sulfurivermis fontis TaxID=1972068 RepID=UPI0018D4E3A6|nr:DUF302 domain-containing protein [Sulfurivermis fontis]